MGWGVGRLGPGRGWTEREEQELHRAGGTGPRKPQGESKWDEGTRGWGETVKQRLGTVGKARRDKGENL